MTRQKLKFRIDGGLNKLAEIYAGGNADTYWANPEKLLEALQVAPAKEIRLSLGYKKLSDALGTFDFSHFHDTIQTEGREECGLNLSVLQTMWEKTGGFDCSVHLDEQQLQGPIVAVAVSMITVAVAFVNLSGRNEDIQERAPTPVQRKKPPMGPKFSADALHNMAQHAQIVADHIWFS